MTGNSITRRTSLGLLAAMAATPANAAAKAFDVHEFGATGDGITNDTASLQKAIDAAAAAGKGARVRLRPGKVYLTGPLQLMGGIELHLDGDAELRVSTDPADYPDPKQGVLHGKDIQGLTLSGTGTINGRSPDFMDHYDAANEWWVPKPFRPRLLVLENAEDLTIRDVTFLHAPSWTVHLLGCRRVLVEHISIRNQPDVPNCDGIDPDHCQDVEIRNCHIVCGDDAIVIKTTAGHDAYGPSRRIAVRDCVLETQDAGLKIGTETTQDIHDILFERCQVVNGSRGLCIQLRDQGNVYDVTFRDITFTARYFSLPWWGRGEAISFTALPRTPQTVLGRLYSIRVQNVSGRAENSIRIEGHASSRVQDVTLDNVKVRFERWTGYPGGVFDNRPTTAVESTPAHATPGIFIRHADRVSLKTCEVTWGATVPDDFTYAIEAEDVTGLSHDDFNGTAAHAQRDPAVVVR